MDCFCAPPRSLACRVVLLDERELMHDIQDNCTGQELLDAVFRHLDLLETSYFGLRFVDRDNQTIYLEHLFVLAQHWLEADKRLKRQLRGDDRHTLYFGVKFYAADPCKLLEEITRYQLFLQVKQDVLRGRLPVNFELAAELAAFALQSELGDYVTGDAQRHGQCATTTTTALECPSDSPRPPGYVSELRLAPHQTPELEARVAELHKTLGGMSPAAAELRYLDKVKWLDMYGVDLHPVLGEDSASHYLGLAPSGLLLLRGRRPVAHYYWPRVARGDRKGRYFMLRVVDKDNSASTYGFETSSRAACHHLWRCCSEQHAFFRAQQLAPGAGARADVFACAERFRHSNGSGGGVGGSVTRQRPPPAFTRAPSRRLSRAGLDTRDTLNSVAVVEVTNDADDRQPLEVGVDLGDKNISENRQPGPVTIESPYRATCGPISYSGNGGSSSPRSGRSGRSARSSRSARSAPHARRGMYRGSPPPALPAPLRAARHRSASVDSQSSGESRNGRKHRHRSRRGRASDAESEASRGSSRPQRDRRHRTSSDTDCRRRTTPRHREYSLVDSEAQWREVQRLRATAGNEVGVGVAVGVASVRRAEHKHRKHRKHHRSRSSSPDKSWLPSELKEHLDFKLIDTSGMTEAQLKEIPYTVVQTSQARQNKLRHSDRDRHKHRYVNITELSPGLRSSGRGVDPVTTSSLHRATAPRPTLPAHSNNDHSNSSSGEIGTGSRVCHDHTDSGLGADQDYAYSSERSSDSAKHPVGPRASSSCSRDQTSNESCALRLRVTAPAPTGKLTEGNDADVAQDRRREIDKPTHDSVPAHSEMSTEL